jgi:BirA family biotin operon repressor/biotin-[acetyl-CoA-carboxylase] ligase
MTSPQAAFPIRVFERVTSTNDTIHQAGEDGEPEGTTHLAREQTQGRGRGSHTWWSPPGAGLWMSTLLRPTALRPRWSGISLIAGAAVRLAIEELGVQGVELFWPNDLLVRGRKLGGILGEVRSRGERAWIALGMGINLDLTRPAVRERLPEELRGRAICLREAGAPSAVEPLALARKILEAFWPLYRRFLAGESPARLAGGQLAHVGRRVTLRLSDGSERRATVLGLDEGGELRVEEADGSKASITAAEVVYE